MSKLTIKAKLILLVLFSLIMLAAICVTGWYGVNNLAQAIDTVSERSASVGALSTLHSSQMVSVGEIRRARSWDHAQFDFLDPKDAVQEAHKFFTDIRNNKKEADNLSAEAYRTYNELPKAPEEAGVWNEFIEDWEKYQLANREIVKTIDELASTGEWTRVPAGISVLHGHDDNSIKTLKRMSEKLTQLLSLSKKYSEQARQDADVVKATARNIILIVFFAAAVGLAIIAVQIVSTTVESLNGLRQAMVRVAEHSDFTSRIVIKGSDEVSEAGKAFNELLDKIQLSLRDVLANAARIKESVQQVLDAATHVSGASTVQSEEASAMSAAIEEMTVTIVHVSDTAKEVLECSKRAGVGADRGKTIISDSAEEIALVAATISKAGGTISDLGKQSDGISIVVQVIKDVAAQTNLLALNAAIEAARAGEEGRGFAVVADEVRALAERTTRSADEIETIVVAMQRCSREASQSMRSVEGQVERGSQFANLATVEMGSVRDAAGQVTVSINGISDALDEQRHAATDVARRVELVSQMSMENSESAIQAAAIANDLRGFADSLHASASQFKV